MSVEKYVEDSPLETIQDDEFFNLILDFCTYVCIVKNKKMNFPSIFVEVLKDKKIYRLYLEYCGFEDEREAIKEFIKIDDSIARSKFLKKVLNKNGI